jgi:two-component system sensor histidine kinase PhoQ
MALVRSLRARVILWVSVALIVLFAVTIFGLDAAFTRSTERALREVLDAQALGLIALAETDANDELTLPAGALDPRFEAADSGVFASILDADGRAVWESQSLVGKAFPVRIYPAPGEEIYATILDAPGLPPLETLLFGVTWEFADGAVLPYTFAIGASLEPYVQRQRAFRRNLIGWFTGLTATMVVVLGGLLTFVLHPLRRLERQVRAVERGERARVTGRYPSELVGLAGSLNALIESETRRLQRYRFTLDDLAHSLKTPLAAMRSLLSELGASGAAQQPDVDAMHREVERMDQRVSYQLRRARASGATGIGVEPVLVAPLVADMQLTLDKVYRDKDVQCELAVPHDAVFRGGSGDLTELLGNVMENGYKYCAGRVRVTVSASSRGEADLVAIVVEDDGRGMNAHDAAIERGKRADESVPGQGIGLAVVREIVELYQGRMEIGRSELGGAAVRIELARAGA